MSSRNLLSNACGADWNAMQSLLSITQQLKSQDEALANCISTGSLTDFVFCDARTDKFKDACSNTNNGQTIDIYWEVLGKKYIESVFQQCIPKSCLENAEDVNGLLWSWGYATYCEKAYWREGLETACCNVNYYARVTATDNGGHYRKQCHPTETITGGVVCDTLYYAQACCYSDAGCPGALWGCSERWGYPCPYAACLPGGPVSQWIGEYGRYFLFTDWTGEPVYIDVDQRDGSNDDWIFYFHERECERDGGGGGGYSTSCAGKDVNEKGLGNGATLKGTGFVNNKGPSGENGFLFARYSNMEIGTKANTLFDMYTYYYVCHFMEQPYTFGRDPDKYEIDDTALPDEVFTPSDNQENNSQNTSSSTGALLQYGREWGLIVILILFTTYSNKCS